MRSIPGGLTLCLLLSVATARGEEPDSEVVFKQLDRDGNGVLQSDEVDEAQAKSFQRLLRIGDKDENGELTRKEYQAALTPAEPVDSAPGDGAGPFGRDGRRPPFDGERLFQMADKDGDGKLTLEELPEPLKPRLAPLFERLGRDALTQDDLAQLRDRFAAGRPQPPFGPDGEKRPERPDSPRERGKERDAGGPPPILRVLDSDKDGRLSRDELAELGKKFEEFDLNGDDRLDLPELTQLLNAGPPPEAGPGPRQRSQQPQRSPQRGPGGDPAAFFDRLDRDQDGFISKDEAPEPMQQRFDRIDQDGDGRLSIDELKRVASRNRPNAPNKPKPE